jgi:hypothetical protein
MINTCYSFSGDTELFLFFDVITWAISKYYEYNYVQAIESINHFYAHNTRLWDDYWYEHEGYSQIICGILYENEGRGNYRDSGFDVFANDLRIRYANMFSSLGIRRMNIIGDIDIYPVDQSIEFRLSYIENSL